MDGSWFWGTDDDNWNPFNEEHCAILTSASESGNSGCVLLIAGQKYIIDLRLLTQQNEVTGGMRAICRGWPSAPPRTVQPASSFSYKELKEELASRGLNTSGKKIVLIDRLEAAWANETALLCTSCMPSPQPPSKVDQVPSPIHAVLEAVCTDGCRDPFPSNSSSSSSSSSSSRSSNSICEQLKRDEEEEKAADDNDPDDEVYGHLVCVLNDVEQVYAIVKDTVVCGRGESSDVAILDKSVSRSHARLTFINRKEAHIVDLGSTSGCIIKQQGVAKKVPTKNEVEEGIALPPLASVYLGAARVIWVPERSELAAVREREVSAQQPASPCSPCSTDGIMRVSSIPTDEEAQLPQPHSPPDSRRALEPSTPTVPAAKDESTPPEVAIGKVHPKYGYLVCVKGVDELIYALNKSIVICGRSENSDLVLMDPSISRAHARITFKNNKHASIIDLGSFNGCTIKGVKAPKLVEEGDEGIFLPPFTNAHLGKFTITWVPRGESLAKAGKRAVSPVAVAATTLRASQRLKKVLEVPLDVPDVPEYDVFLSHRQLDAQDFCALLYEKLVAKGLKVFLDRKDAGVLHDLPAIVANSKCFVFVLSNGIFQSKWCLLELYAAVSNQVPCVPLRLDGAMWEGRVFPDIAAPYVPQAVGHSDGRQIPVKPLLEELFKSKAIEHSREYFEAFFGKLVAHLQEHVPALSGEVPSLSVLPPPVKKQKS